MVTVAIKVWVTRIVVTGMCGGGKVGLVVASREGEKKEPESYIPTNQTH
jgi:dienelactone hydrolase